MNISKFISIIHRKKQQYIKEKMKDLNLDIGISDYPVILILNSRRKQGPTEIAKAFDLTKSQVSQCVRKLEKLGYVTQERDKECRSKVVVEITPEGIEIAKTLKAITKEWHKIAGESFEEEELQKIHKSLVKIAINVGGDDIKSMIRRPSMKNKSI